MKVENIIISNHAKQRAIELGIDPENIKILFLKAIYQGVNIFREIYKFLKYKKKQYGVCYYYLKGSSYNPYLLFTVKHKDNDVIIITITKRKL